MSSVFLGSISCVWIWHSIRNICSGFLQDTFQIKKEKKLQTRLNFINWQTQVTIILIHLQSEDQWTRTKDGSFLICHKTNKQTKRHVSTHKNWTDGQSNNLTKQYGMVIHTMILFCESWYHHFNGRKNCFYYWNIHFPIINKHQELKSLALMCFEGWVGEWSNGD